MTIDETIKALRELSVRATPGPWKYAGESGDFWLVDKDYQELPWTQVDVMLLASMRNSLPALLDEIERLRNRLGLQEARLVTAWRDQGFTYEATKEMLQLPEKEWSPGEFVHRPRLDAERALVDELAEALRRVDEERNPAAWLNLKHALTKHAQARGGGK